MKLVLPILIAIFYAVHVQAQSKQIDSLDNLIRKASSDTQRINLKIEKLKILSNGNLDSAIAFSYNGCDESN